MTIMDIENILVNATKFDFIKTNLKIMHENGSHFVHV